MACITASGLRKAFGDTVALDEIDLTIGEGRIVGLIGPNGAGKSTFLAALLGLTDFDGTLTVLGRDPWRAREALMRDVCFIADVAVLPRWMRVSQALDYVAGVHPRFDRAKAEALVDRTSIKRRSRVRDLSKGMVTQLHLALVMAIDAKLLVLDEPTLGLDILFRKQFYDALLNDYFDGGRTIVVTTHQVEEVEHVLTDVLFIDRGRIVLDCSMEHFESRYAELSVAAEQSGRSPRARADPRAHAVRSHDPAVRRRRSRATRGARRRAHAEHRRPVRRDRRSRRADRGKARGMTAAVEAPIDPPRAAPTAVRRDFTAPRLVYWSLRRELWEHRSIVWAPVIVAGMMLLGFAVGANRIVGMMDAVSVLDVVQQGELLVKPLAFTAIPLLITVSLVAMFYCLDALHGERRDRSILFWKSLPVSDVVTVASKALVPLVVLPVIACVTFLVMQLLILLIGSGVLLAHGLDGALPWRGAAGAADLGRIDRLPRRPRAVARADLRLAAARVRMGAPLDVPVGRAAPARAVPGREDRVRHRVRMVAAEGPPVRLPVPAAADAGARRQRRSGRAVRAPRPVGRPAGRGPAARRRDRVPALSTAGLTVGLSACRPAGAPPAGP